MPKHDLVYCNEEWHQGIANGLQVCNRSKVTCLVSFAQAAQQLAQHAVELTPAGDVSILARDALDMTFFYRYGMWPSHRQSSREILCFLRTTEGIAEMNRRFTGQPACMVLGCYDPASPEMKAD